MDNARYSDKTKAFNKGVLTLVGGEKQIGEIAKPNRTKVNFRNKEGIISAVSASEIEKVEVAVEGEQKVFISAEGLLTEELINGNTFWVYNNPKPTTVNKKKTNAANSMVSLGAGIASSAVMTNTAKSLGADAVELNNMVKSASTEELIAARLDIAKINGYQSIAELDEKGSKDETTSKLDAALQLEIASRKSDQGLVIYHDEIIVVNKNTKEKMILYKDKELMNDKLEGLLMGCYSFLELDKKVQKQYYDIDNLKRTFEMLDECY